VISPNQSTQRRTLKARYVFPVVAEPIVEGTVTILGEQIVAVGSRAVGGQTEDLGNVAILPGLVNAHTHLEFSDLPAPLGRPGMGFVDWIEAVIAFRRQSSGAARQPVELGLAQCHGLGVTAVGEIARPGWQAEPFERAPADSVVFLELIAPTLRAASAAWELACEHVRASRAAGRWRAGLSPHAPYSVHPSLIRRLVEDSQTGLVPLAFHLAESREEIELLRRGTGPFREFLERIGGWQPDAIPPGTRPLDYLRLLSQSHRAIVVHGNYLDDEEIAFLAEHRDRMSVVYCPRTHAYFAHDPYPLAGLLSAGVTVALGTDGRASSPDLSVLAEVRFLARQGTVRGSELLEMGTLHAARALGLEGELGTLEPGKVASLAIVRLPERDAADPHELLFDSDLPVEATWWRGRVRGEGLGIRD